MKTSMDEEKEQENVQFLSLVPHGSSFLKLINS
jgi:hypothetical protein